MRPGADGFSQFQKQLQRITGMPMLDAMQITFQCKAPDTGEGRSISRPGPDAGIRIGYAQHSVEDGGEVTNQGQAVTGLMVTLLITFFGRGMRSSRALLQGHQRL